jgi:hypothetical protein
MKKLMVKLSLGLLSLLVLLLTGCQKEVSITPAGTQEKVQYLIDSYGFNPSDVVVKGKTIVVEGDMIFNLDQVLIPSGSQPSEHSGCAQERGHRRVPKLITTTNTISIVVDPSLSTVWKTAITGAVADWNALYGTGSERGRLIFTSTEGTYCPVNGTYVTVANLGANSTIAQAQLPVETSTNVVKPGGIMQINSGYNGSVLNAEKRRFAIKHELGHTIGFRHTGTSDGSLIDISTWCNVSDIGSTMRSNLSSSSTLAFTTCDKKAYKKLYPF